MFLLAVAASTPAVASRRSASALAARWYSGVAKGVTGASGFRSGRVAIQAFTAGRNSLRNRLR